MDFRQLLRRLSSVQEKELFCEKAARDPEAFESLLRIAFSEKDPLAWRAAWVIDGSAEKNPSAALPHIPEIINRLGGLKSTGTIRSVLRMLCRYDIPEENQGSLVDLCFGYLVSELYPVAVKVHAMQIIYQHVLLYPELKEELTTVIEDQMANNSVGFKSRGRRLIRQMNSM